MKKIILTILFLSSISYAWSFNKNSQGGLTGYSTPINNDIFKQMKFDDDKKNLKSPNVMTDLFSSPQKNYGYNSSNTLKELGEKGVGSKCGVTIIYD
ncbi:MAG: hypothetical protein IJ877_06355 [Candidatus Gastranaerophilales bacterium]|nr:hypothetical protein [Candidatus Gastranaerophilales bacterium]